MKASYHCSFCGKGNTETELMLAGPYPLFMCLECVDDAHEQAHRAVTDKRDTEQLFAEARRCAFCIPFPIASTLTQHDRQGEKS